MKKEITFPKYLLYRNDRTYAVVGYIDDPDIKFEDNKCYVEKKTGDIYVCCIGDKPLHTDVPIIFINGDEKTYGGTHSPLIKKV